MIQEIEIDNWDELENCILKAEVNVRWQIKSDIGPGWIGRGKRFRLSSNNIPVSYTHLTLPTIYSV